MRQTVSWQFLFLFLNLGVGAGIGLLLDCYRLFRRRMHPGWFLTQVADFLFWVVSALAAFGIFFLASGGELNLYTLLMVPVGMLTYLRYASSYLQEPLRRAGSLVRRFFCFCRRAIHWCLWAFFFFPLGLLVSLLKFCGQLVIVLLRLALLPFIGLFRWLRQMSRLLGHCLLLQLKKLF
jgi:spore cortex biosynthesis protein YabQ